MMSIDEQIVAAMRLADETREQAEYQTREAQVLLKKSEALGEIVATLVRLRALEDQAPG